MTISRAHGEEIRKRGFKALKTNILPMIGDKLGSFTPGFAYTPGWPELNWDHSIVRAATDGLSALRQGAGPDMGIMLDINFNFKTEGFRRIAEAVAPFRLNWLEIDLHDPASLALIRREAPCPIASCETLHGRREFKPYFEQYAMDVPIIDVIWNGLSESLKIAAMADAYEMNVAPHNFYGHMSDHHQRAFLRRGAEFPHHGNRHRQREVARRVRHLAAGDRERRAGAAHRARLGHRHRRGGRARPRTQALNRPRRRNGEIQDHHPGRRELHGRRRRL